MKNPTNPNPNSVIYYNALQLVLPLDLSISIDKNDPMFSFLEAMEGVNLSKYVSSIRSNNTHSHDRGMLLKVILFAYSEGKRSLSEIEHLCKTDIRYLYLSNEERPSKMAFQRLIASLTDTIDNIFFDVSKHIAYDLMLCDEDVQYIDGTKIEANAHKNSFVYKKRIIHAEERMYPRITESICVLNQTYGYNLRIKNIYDSLDVGFISQYLMEQMVFLNVEIKYGIGKRKTEIQRFYDEFLQYYTKLLEYEYWLNIMQNRNSCSKIDYDATFMATKWDYYNQSGVTRPCYNAQIAVTGGIIVNSQVYQTPGDTGTWIDFLLRYKEANGCFPRYPVADAGYGSYDNYMFNIKNGIELVQKYNMYGKQDDKKFQKRIYNAYNWKINEEGYKVCPAGRAFSVNLFDKYKDTLNDNLCISQIYVEPNECKECARKRDCTKGERRTTSKNAVLEELQGIVDKNLSTEQGKEMKRQRSIQVEGAFGVIKQDFKFTKFTRRGLKNVKTEFLLVCLGYNLRKYHISRMKNPVSMMC